MSLPRIRTKPFTGPSNTLERQQIETNSSSQLGNVLAGRNSLSRQRLEEIVDIKRDLTLFSNGQLNTMNPRRLDSQGLLSLLPLCLDTTEQNHFNFLMGKKKY